MLLKLYCIPVHVIIRSGGSMTGIQMCIKSGQRNSLVFSDQDLRSVMICCVPWCWCRLDLASSVKRAISALNLFIHSQPFRWFMLFSFRYGVITLWENFSRFRSLCSKKISVWDAAKHDAIHQWSIYVYLTLTSTTLTAERCTVRIRNTHQPLWTCCIVSASFRCVCRVIFR